jgi:hypothetical protein
MSKITIKVTKTAFYNGALVYPNEIIKNYKGDVPSWATLAGGKEQKKDETPVKNPQIPAQPQTPVSPIKDKGEKEGEKNPEEKADCEQSAKGGSGELSTVDTFNANKQVTEIQLQEELDALLDESVSKGIILENAENKTLDEQIAELKTLLGKE